MFMYEWVTLFACMSVIFVDVLVISVDQIKGPLHQQRSNRQSTELGLFLADS